MTSNQISSTHSSVIQGDCVKVLSQFPSASIDMVLTDPPYIAKYVSRDGQRIANDDRADWLQPSFAQIFRVLKRHSFCVSFYGWHQVDKFMQAWRLAGFRPVGHLVFQKSYASKNMFLSYRHEQAYLLAKGNPSVPDAPISDVQTWKYSGNRLHPTQKPVSSLIPLIESFSKPRDIILDPFCGSGSTLLAARLAGRRSIGIELSSDYCSIARQRAGPFPNWTDTPSISVPSASPPERAERRA